MMSFQFPNQLPPPKIAKDAAQARQRILPEFFQPLTAHTFTELLGLPGLTVTHF